MLQGGVGIAKLLLLCQGTAGDIKRTVSEAVQQTYITWIG